MKRAHKQPRKKLTYEAACKAAASMDFWTVEDAAALLTGEIPPGLSRRKLGRVKAERVARVAHILSGAECVVNPESPASHFRVPPTEIVEWAKRKLNGVVVPDVLIRAVLSGVKEGERANSYMRQSTFRKHRCQALAELLWGSEQTKHLTLEAMAKRSEILDIGCEGKSYTHKRIMEWIKEQNPNRKPGRRPKVK